MPGHCFAGFPRPGRCRDARPRNARPSLDRATCGLADDGTGSSEASLGGTRYLAQRSKRIPRQQQRPLRCFPAWEMEIARRCWTMAVARSEEGGFPCSLAKRSNQAQVGVSHAVVERANQGRMAVLVNGWMSCPVF